LEAGKKHLAQQRRRVDGRKKERKKGGVGNGHAMGAGFEGLQDSMMRSGVPNPDFTPVWISQETQSPITYPPRGDYS
jgi:hypothetical protein